MTLGDSIFRSNLIEVLKGIHFELKRANELKEIENALLKMNNDLSQQTHQSFFEEQTILNEDIDEAIGQARNINHNFQAVNRKVEEVEKEEVYDNH